MPTAGLQHSRRLPAVLAFVAAYVAFSAILMATNVITFGLYDAKFGGPDIWPLYWGIWAVAYTPAAFVATATAWRLGRRLKAPLAFLGACLALILVAMEVSFTLDLKWQLLTAEIVVLCIAIPLLSRRWTMQTDN